MTDLSPAAYAVVSGAHAVDWVNRRAIAAALRAAAERNEYKPDMRDEMEVMFSEGWNSYRKEILAIADELDVPSS